MKLGLIFENNKSISINAKKTFDLIPKSFSLSDETDRISAIVEPPCFRVNLSLFKCSEYDILNNSRIFTTTFFK